jgi:diadenosine tetraphosphate (Ap4A) HIT family hydrolase
MLLVSKIGKVFFSECDGYNVLINSGTAADQSINHVHIHIVPRNWNDGIKIELWKRKKVSKKDFVRFNNELKKLLK